MNISWQAIGTVVAIFGAGLSLWKLMKAQRGATVEEGKRMREQEQLQRDLAEAKAKIAELERRSQTADTDMAVIKSDVKHILTSLSKIEEKLDAIAPPTVQGVDK